MKIYFEIEECKNAELLEKMKQVKDYDGFRELALEYGWCEAADAFAATNDWFEPEYCDKWLENYFYGGNAVDEYDSILYYAITYALEYKEEQKEKEINECLNNMMENVREFLEREWDYIIDNNIEEGYQILELYVNGRTK